MWAWHEQTGFLWSNDQWFKGGSDKGVAAQTRQMMRREEPSDIKQEVDKDKAKG